MAQMIEDFARDGVTVERMEARCATVTDVLADDETLLYVPATSASTLARPPAIASRSTSRRPC